MPFRLGPRPALPRHLIFRDLAYNARAIERMQGFMLGTKTDVAIAEMRLCSPPRIRGHMLATAATRAVTIDAEWTPCYCAARQANRSNHAGHELH